MNRVLFPDAFHITQVSAVRALGRSGVHCEVAWPYGPLKKLFKSRYVRHVHPISDLYNTPEQYADDVIRLCRNRSFDVVVPVSVEATEALVSRRKDLERVVATLLPTDEQLGVGLDKVKTAHLCERLGIAHPKTWTIKTRQELASLSDNAEFPIVLKHSRNFGGSRGVRFVGNPDELQKAYQELNRIRSANPVLLAQEFIPGHLFDAVTVAKDGVCPRMFTSVRKLMYPVSGGVTCVSVSTRSRDLKEIAAGIVADLKWNGPIEMEFKLDLRDGKYKLIEINPRFWASLDAATKCNVNFPANMVDLALGKEIPSNFDHEVGARHKFLLGRVPFAVWQLARVAGYSSIRDPQVYSRTTNDIDLRDPLPDAFAIMLVIRSLLRGRFPKQLSSGAEQMILPQSVRVPLD